MELQCDCHVNQSTVSSGNRPISGGDDVMDGDAIGTCWGKIGLEQNTRYHNNYNHSIRQLNLSFCIISNMHVDILV